MSPFLACTLIAVAASAPVFADSVSRQLEAAAKQLATAERQRSAAMRQNPGFAENRITGSETWGDCEPLADDALQKLAANAATDSVTVELIRAVIDTESAGRPCAVSIKGAAGLMQLMPATAERFRLADLFDPEGNVRAGTVYLDELLLKYRGDVNFALAAYNAGPARVDAHGGIPDISETQQYVRTVLERLARRKSEKTGRTEADSTVQQIFQPSAF